MKAAIAAFVRGVAVLILGIALEVQAAIPIYSTYTFKRNQDRPFRRETRFIILHTTEGPAKGSGQKLMRNGEAHYMIDTAGNVYGIVDRRRVAYHCGLSMWNAKTDIDRYSIGIEMVGYHNKDLTAAQIKSLRALIADLKKKYPGVTDDRVLTHSMVAYGSPNQWHKRNHRGRKRCGMKMASGSLRTKLGLRSKPAYDPDVKAKRLIVADKELFEFLYRKSSTVADEAKAVEKYTKTEADNTIGLRRSAWDIARDAYNSPNTTYIFPDGSKKTGDKIKDWKAIPRGTKVIVSSGDEDNTPAKSATQTKTTQATSTSKQPERPAGQNTKTQQSDSAQKKTEPTKGDAAKSSETQDNVIGPKRSAWDIAKAAYNAASTVYVFPDGTRKTGAEIKDWKSIKAGTQVLLADITMESGTNGVVSSATITMAGDAAKELARTIAGDAWNATNTFYITPSGKYYRGSELKIEDFAQFEANSKMLSGYAVGGPVNAKTPIFSICGTAWNKDTTFYLLPNGKIVSGDAIDAAKVPQNTMIFFKE